MNRILRPLADRYDRKTSEKLLKAVNSLKGCHCVFNVYKVLKNESETDERYIVEPGKLLNRQ